MVVVKNRIRYLFGLYFTVVLNVGNIFRICSFDYNAENRCKILMFGFMMIKGL